MDIIQEIRRNYGFDCEEDDRVQFLAENLHSACERLSKELYNSKTHFLLELIQNADDNTYPSNIIPGPVLKLSITDRQIVSRCNEVGFTEANVRAICRVGHSTKKKDNLKGIIGEKGIGFKSVFSVANQVYVSSGEFNFRFDRDVPLGMVAPIADDTYPSTAGWTTIRLQLSDGGADLSAPFRSVKPTLLLFLHRLRSLAININVHDGLPKNNISIQRVDVDENTILLQRSDSNKDVSEKYFVVRHMIKSYEGEPRREGIVTTEIVLAFPLDANEGPIIRDQDVHAFLPLRPVGFTFIIQADFLTPASREDIQKDLPWNITIRDAIVDAFKKAVDTFGNHPTLQYTWFRYLPNSIPDPFFGMVERRIIQRLKEVAVFRSSRGTLHRASKVVSIPKTFRDSDGHPLIPEDCVPHTNYLSKNYNISQDDYWLRLLGVEDMSSDDFLVGLRNMDRKNILRNQSDDWHEKVCKRLKPIHDKVGRLRIIPLKNGSWTTGEEAERCVFDTDIVDAVPPGIDLESVDSVKPYRYSLLQKLGVRRADATLIAERILEEHGRNSPPVETMVEQTWFLFEHRDDISSKIDYKGLKVVDEQDRKGHGHKMYLDVPESGDFDLRDILPDSARFLHSDYYDIDGGMESERIDWLCKTVHLNVAPRLVRGRLSHEFEEMVQRNLDSRRLLLVLEQYWPHIDLRLSEEGIRQLSKTKVKCESGEVLPLKDTFLKKKTLSQYPTLAFLPVDDPNDKRWDFLSTLGVSTDVNPRFLIKVLRKLAEKDQKDVSVENIYKQLEARFEEDDSEDFVLEAFKEPLILASEKGQKRMKWVNKYEVYWDGPPSMTSKITLKNCYPSLDEFFCSKLRISNAPPGIFVSEFESLLDEHRGFTISERIKRAEVLLRNLNDAVSDSETCSHSLLKLGNMAIFPTLLASQKLVLRRLDHFYVPDPNGRLAGFFGNKISLLSPTILPHIRQLLESDICRQKVLYLDKLVAQESHPCQQRQFDSDATRKYASKVGYIERLVCFERKRKLTAKQQDSLTRMRSISVFRVKTIRTTYTLSGHAVGNDDVSVEVDSEAVVEIAGDTFAVAISNGCQNDDIAVAEVLGRHLDIDMVKLLPIINQSNEYAEQVLDHLGASGLVTEEQRDTSWLEKSPRPYLSSSYEPHSVSKSGHLGPTTSSPTIVSRYGMKTSDLMAQIDAINVSTPRATIGSSAVHCSSPRRFIPQSASALSAMVATPTNRNGFDSSDIADRVQQDGTMTQLLDATESISHPRASQLTEDKIITGILGEFYVYKLFSSDPSLDFQVDNWTSELRGEVKGFEPYLGKAVADFKYEDFEGNLTRQWYGESIAEAWSGEWPTYHFEVKSTSGAIREPFYMSRRQVKLALNFSNADLDEAPTDVYVLIRVSGVGTPSISHEVYLDPHQQFHEGGLRIVSQVEVIVGE